MEWDESLRTGNEQLDGQHRELIGLFNDLEAVTEGGPEVWRPILDRLTAQTAVHFGMEETLMAESSYPAEDTARHLHEHAKLTDGVRDHVIGYRSGEMSGISPLVDFMHHWLVDHELVVDRLLIDFVRAARMTSK